MKRDRRRKRVEASHAEDWLMTYADVITLLLCFFAITIVTSLPKKEAQPEPVKQIVQAQPTPPPEIAAFQSPVPPAPLTGDLPFYETIPDIPPENVVPPAPTAQAAPQPENETPAPTALSEIAASLQGQAKLEQKGDRITSLELSSAAFFNSGSATLNKNGGDILHKVATELKDDKYKGYQITVEGHTDDTPIHTAQFPSNWELSTGRASTVVRFFLEQRLPAANLRAAGYADTFPKAPNRDANGHAIQANQAENRRVVIKLEKIDREE